MGVRMCRNDDIVPQCFEIAAVTKGELHNEEIYGLFSSPYITMVIKLSRMCWAKQMERMGR
jgi:hypothetical protein